MCFSKDHCRFFFEKLRKRYKDYKFKHFLVCEYGPTGTKRPHYHCLLMIYSDLPIAKLYEARKEMREFLISDAWPHGYVTEKSFHGRVLAYLTKYCCKPELTGDFHTMKPFTLISRGIGLNYLNKLLPEQIDRMRETLDFTVRYGNSKIQLPRYYVDKILPHSTQDLDKIIIEGFETGSIDFDRYKKIQEYRRKMSAKQRKRDFARAQASFRGFDGLDSVVQEIRDRKMNIEGEFQNFRSKIKRRKDL